VPASIETPSVNSLILADHVYRDGESGKWVIAGTFNNIFTNTLPIQYPLMDVFFQITNVHQPVDLHLRIEQADSGRVVLDVGGPISSPSKLDVVEKKVSLMGFPLEQAGKYWVQLLSNEEILTQAPLQVIMKGTDSQGENGHVAD